MPVSLLAWQGSAVAAPPAATPPAPKTVAVKVHTALVSGTPVASETWLASQWDSVRSLLGPAGLLFEPSLAPAPKQPLPRALETRADRDALRAFAVPHALNVFVVEALRDVDEPERQRMGVHWRAGGIHYVIVATYAVPGGAPCPPQYKCSEHSGLLTHELGHFFGLGHDGRADNVMSYVRAGRALWFDDSQKARVLRVRDAEIAKGLTIVQ